MYSVHVVKYKKICESGIGNEQDRMRTFLIYMDLVECRQWYNVTLCPLHQLRLLLVAGYPTATDNKCCVWPLSADDSISPSSIHTALREVKACNGAASLLAGIVSPDSTVVYYTVTDGLVPPPPVDDQNAAKVKQQRRLRRKRTR